MPSWSEEALSKARPSVYWEDTIGDVADPVPVSRDHDADLVVIGAGFTGLWTAVLAAAADPGRKITVVEAEHVGFGASSRNGGFCEASLTHGPLNGVKHWPDEIDLIQRLGDENLDGLERTIADHNIDCDFHRSNVLNVALEPWQLAEMESVIPEYASVGFHIELLDEAATRARVDSPTFIGGMLSSQGSALVNPAQLAWGLRTAAESLDVTVLERSPVRSLEQDGSGVIARCDGGSVRAAKAVVATNAYTSTPVRRIKRYVIPVYDHVLMTEPLSTEQRASIGWEHPDGLGDWANQFHYYRLTADGRILWGGYDATYHYNNGVDPAYDQRGETHSVLAQHFFETFPQLEGLRFSHRWGGPIASSTRFTAAWGTTHDGATSWVSGYTGLGVGASRFGAQVALDLVDGVESERTELSMVRDKPFPFPPEPFRSIGISITKRAMQKSDRNEGKEGLWLRLLDKFGVGFDS